MELLLCGLVYWNAGMTEMEQSGIEVVPAFADNVRKQPPANVKFVGFFEIINMIYLY